MAKYCIGTNIIGMSLYIEHFVCEQKYVYNKPTLKCGQRSHKENKNNNSKHK